MFRRRKKLSLNQMIDETRIEYCLLCGFEHSYLITCDELAKYKKNKANQQLR